MSLNAVSKHIRLLERADLVRRRKQGREHLLSFNPEPLTRAEQWIAERKANWERRLDALGDFLAATKPGRKSVVEGKSVSVRVDHGGSCIIKKKKKEPRI